MVPKIILCVILTTVAFQGLHGRRLKADKRGVNVEAEIENVISSALEHVSGVERQLASVRSSADTKLLQMSQGLTTKVSGIMQGGQAEVEGIVQALSRKVEESVSGGHVSAECANARMVELTDMTSTGFQDMKKCSLLASNAWNDLSDRVNSMLITASALLDSAPQRVRDCVLETSTAEDLPQITQCVQTEKDSIVFPARSLVSQVHPVIAEGAIGMDQSIGSVTACTRAAQEEIRQKAAVIEQKLLSC